jgi:hypothetical protein
MKRIVGMAMLFMGASAACFAGSVPEIDPPTAGSAIALLAGGLLVIQYRRKK